MGKFQPGDQLFMVVSNRYVRTCEVLKYAGGFYTIRFTDTPGGMRILEDRLFATREEAEASFKGKSIPIGRDIRNPWQYR